MPTETGNIHLNLGRRESDKWLSSLLSNVMLNVAKRSETVPIAPKTRRPRRTKLQLRQALKTALEAVKTEFPHWPIKRQLTRAKVLVRMYKY